MNIHTYLIVNGKQYNSGSVFIMKRFNKQVEATFLYYKPDCDRIFFSINGKHNLMSPDVFRRDLISVTDRVDPKVRTPVVKRVNEFDIDGMLIGWVWYVVLMVATSIFKDVAQAWAIISCIFFCWRAKKIKEEGTYIEW